MTDVNDDKRLPVPVEQHQHDHDGFDDHDEGAGGYGPIEKFTDGDWSIGGVPSDPKRRLVAVSSEVAGLGRTKIYEAIAAGELKARKYGKRRIILREELRAFLVGFPVAVHVPSEPNIGGRPRKRRQIGNPHAVS